MVGLALGRDRFDLGRVVRRTVDMLKLNLAAFSLLTLVLFVVPHAILELLRVLTTPHGLIGRPSPVSGLLGILFGLASLFLGCAVQAAVLRASVEGRRDSVGDLIAYGVRLALPLLGLTLLLMIALGIGFFLLIVPGVILAVVWSVSAPALVIEGTGVFGAFGRSNALTRGSRWSIFLLFLLWVLLLLVGSLIVLGPFGFGVSLMRTGAMSATLVSYVIVSALLSAVVTVVQTALTASVYVELRTLREGYAPGGLAQTFD